MACSRVTSCRSGTHRDRGTRLGARKGYEDVLFRDDIYDRDNELLRVLARSS